ncbi:MAG: co-chaperone GroES [Sphaerochaetaceae bacterium]|nr:co-chaperone GroES [Sphaerochaetaceae bacterium]
MNIRPLGERVLVKAEKTEEKTASGIVLPQTSQEKSQFASVIAVGDDVKSVKKGERILFDKYAGTALKIDSEDYLILELKEVLAIIG